MSIGILKQKRLNELYESIDANLDEYLYGDFKEYINNEELTHQHDGQSFNIDKLRSISGAVVMMPRMPELFLMHLRGLLRS